MIVESYTQEEDAQNQNNNIYERAIDTYAFNWRRLF
jgi:hypothetical protein